MPSFCLAPLSEEQVGYAKSIEGFQREIPDNGTGTEILPLVVDTSRYAVLIYPRFRENGAWKEVTAYSHPVDYMLPDSSSITLFPHSSVRFHAKDYRKSSRKVHMEGKVAFSVKHDNAHPFTVEGKLSQVRYWVLSLPSMRAVQTQLSCKSHRERCSSQQSGNRTL